MHEFVGTNTVKLYNCTDVNNGEKPRYYDFTSLYPLVNKSGRHWIGHLSARSNRHQQVLWVCQMHTATTRKTLPPILPLHQHGKLTFPLCATCREGKMTETMLDCSNICYHTDQERQITSTWYTSELQKAVKKGYQVLHVHKVWHLRRSLPRLCQHVVENQ